MMNPLAIDELPKYLRDKIPPEEPQKPPNGYIIPVSFPYISPRSKERVLQAIEEATISSATSVVGELEEAISQFYKVPFVKACSSGYSALVLALKLANIKKGDSVLVPSFTMAAVSNAVTTVGARPVFVDCEEGQFNPSAAEYQVSLTNDCKALIVTHTYGIPADIEPLVSFADDNGLVLIEDIAEAIGTDYKGKYVGTFGDFATASLYANKTITSGDGGFVMSTKEDKSLRHRANSYANHGFTPKHHFLHFEHSGNYKMSGLQAALVLPAIDDIPTVMEDRKRISATYRENLDKTQGLSLMPLNPSGKEAPWMFGVLVESREKRREVREKLARDGIETRDFFFPLHLQPMAVDMENETVSPPSLPQAESLGLRGFYLPTYYGLGTDDIVYVSNKLKMALRDAE
uniref:Aminotransferase class I/classII domain-containing protein n=2 Tax=Amphimedon queenslandica TaxID=400682 RepID=A0A1X7U068_AMPQE